MGIGKGGARAFNIGVGIQLPGVLEIIVVEVQRQLEGAGRHHHVGVVEGVAFAGDSIIVRHGEVLAVEPPIRHKIRHHILQRKVGEVLRDFIGGSRKDQRRKKQKKGYYGNKQSFHRPHLHRHCTGKM